MPGLEDAKKKLLQMKEEFEAIPHNWDARKPYMENIEDISVMSCVAQKPIKTNFQKGYIVPANSNIVDTEFSIIDQQMKIKDKDKDKLLKLFQQVCEEQKSDVKGFENEILGVAICKELYARFPEERRKIDLPQTLRMFNILKQSRNPENKDMLPEVEKDLQAKAWRYFCGEKKDMPKMVRPTPYSVSCLQELEDYMVNKMHAPKDVITPKLKDIEYSMMSSIDDVTMQNSLSREARKLVFFTAVDNPDHEKSSRIIENINFIGDRRQKRGGINE